VGLILVLAEQQSSWKERLSESTSSRVLVQPLTLRQLRRVVRHTLGASVNGQCADESDDSET